jgi:phosphoglycolate phosphatase
LPALVIFDLDGTLVDSLPDIAGALNEALAEAGRPPLPAHQIRGFVGDGAAKLVQRALAPDAGAVDVVTARFRHFYALRLHAETRPYPGIAPVLGRLAAAMPLAVVTNKPAELARPLLAALGLDMFFADVVADGDGFARKPAPDAGLWLLTRHGVAAQAALVVGDGLPDMRFARALGARAAAVTWGYVEPDDLRAEQPAWLISQPAELLSIALGPLRPGP